jgi:hypothetical protein
MLPSSDRSSAALQLLFLDVSDRPDNAPPSSDKGDQRLSVGHGGPSRRPPSLGFKGPAVEV